jgi:hypothetical protein
MAPRRLPVQSTEPSGMKLRDSRHRDAGYYPRPRGVEALPGGARHPVEIWTDHKKLEYFRVAQELNRRQARWSLYLLS